MNKNLVIGATLIGGAAVTMLLLSRKRAAISLALEERQRWRNIVETDPEARPLLDKYWASVTTSRPPASEPWSAAFISWVMTQTQPEFPASESHLGYVRGAFQNNGKPGLYGYKDPQRFRIPVKAGDIVVRSREGETITARDVENQTGFKTSHGDLVVSVRDGEAVGIGGNVANKVTTKAIPLNPDGTLADPRYFAILREQPGAVSMSTVGVAGLVFGAWWFADSWTRRRGGYGKFRLI